MDLKCCCKNNTPVKLPNDNKDGERYECYYCKFKWRYLEVHNTICSNCNDHGINLKTKINNTVKCALCGKIHDITNYATKNILVFW